MQNSGRADRVRVGILATVDMLMLRPIFSAAASMARLWAEAREELDAERQAMLRTSGMSMMGARGGESGSEPAEDRMPPAPAARAARGAQAPSRPKNKGGRPRKAKPEAAAGE